MALWAKQGKIRSIRLGSHEKAAHRYHGGDLSNRLGLDTKSEKRIIAYARVSSSKQREAGDLGRQVKSHRPDITHIYQDVASGLNFKQKGLLALLDELDRGNVAAVVVTYRDRLARFGTELLERSFRKHGTALDLVFGDQAEGAPQRELADDLLAVCNFFVASNNGRRAAAMSQSRKRRTQPLSTEEGTGSDEEKSRTGRAHGKN